MPGPGGDTPREADAAPVAVRSHVLTRLRTVHGQLGGAIHMLEQDRSSADVLTQLAAVTHALQRAGYQMVVDEIRVRQGDSSPDDRAAIERVEKLFLAFG